jgi:hypothetical protein
MQSMNKYLILILLVLGTAGAALAQTDEEKNLQQIVRAYAKARNGLLLTREPKTVMIFFDKEMEGARTEYGLGRRLAVSRLNYATFADGLQDLLDQGVEVRVDVKQFLHTSVEGTKGLVVATHDNVRFKDSVLLDKATVVYTMLFQKKADIWKIVNYTATVVTEEKAKGACVCELFEGEGGSLATKLAYPNGENFSFGLNNFVFTKEKGRTLIASDKGNFALTDAKEVQSLKPDGTKGTVLGKANNEREAVLLILAKVLYTDHCLQVVPRK